MSADDALINAGEEAVAVSLRLMRDDLDPDWVTALLGCAPTHGVRKGEWQVRPNGMRFQAQTGMWRLSLDKDQPGNLTEKISRLLALVSADPDVWRQLTDRFKVDLFCGLWLPRCNFGVALDPPTMVALGKRGIVLDLDVYAPEQDDLFQRSGGNGVGPSATRVRSSSRHSAL